MAGRYVSALRDLLSHIELRRTMYLIYGIFFVSYAFLAWYLVGYILLSDLVLIWILLGAGGVLVAFSVYVGEEPRIVKLLPYIGFLLALMIFGQLLVQIVPAYGTDELAGNTYAAYLFIHGLNPYVDSNMAGVYAFSHIPPYSITPMTTGGAVDFFVYPGFSILLFIPTLLLGLRSYDIVILFSGLAIIMIAYYYRKKGYEALMPLTLIAMVISIEYIFYSLTGDDDIIWVFFLGLAYIFRKSPWISGVFYGLSISFKQITAIVAPFFLYFIYMESGRKPKADVDLVAGAAISFFATNIPFILMGPTLWFKHIIAVDTQPILGAGIGPSILSFAGFVYIPSLVFLIVSVTLLLVLFVLYVAYYGELKYAFFAFPMIIFIFNFRVLENYIAFWPYMILLVLPDFLTDYREKVQNAVKKPANSHPFATGFSGHKRITAIFVAAIIASGALASIGYEYNSVNADTAVHINWVGNASDPIWAPGYISEIAVNLTYTPFSSEPVLLHVNFRLLPSATGDTYDINGLLWHTDSFLRPGNNTVVIYPDTYADLLKNNLSFRLEAYYGNISAYYPTTTLDINNSYGFPIPDPNMTLPSFLPNPVYPGWNFSNIVTNGNGSFKLVLGGFNLSQYVKINGRFWSYSTVTARVNFTQLSLRNITLNYTVASGVKGTSFNSFYSSNMSRLAGIMLESDNGFRVIVAYNSSATSEALYQVNSTFAISITDNIGVNFNSLLRSIEASEGWSFTLGDLSYVVASYGVSGYTSAIFSNIHMSM